MKKDNTTEAFFALVKAGLWEQDVQLALLGQIDFNKVYRLAEEQSVIGLVAAGLEHVVDIKVPQETALQFVSQTLQLEQRNSAMNFFIGQLIEKTRTTDIYTILVKGQGIAQCYERPLWRACGDIDLLLSADNYDKAKSLLSPLGKITEPEEKKKRHFAMQIGCWPIELHGTLHSGLSHSVDKVLDEVQGDVFFGGNVRSWMNDRTHVFLPGVNCDVVYVFSHIIQHFYKGGVGLRQICDWSRLLWTYNNSIDKNLLEQRLRRMRLMSEWKVFGCFAVDYLGLPIETMPFYEKSFKGKSNRLVRFLIEVGNFGHNRDLDYYRTKTYFVRKCASAWRRLKDLCRHSVIFPLDSTRFFFGIMYNGVVSAIRGE